MCGHMYVQCGSVPTETNRCSMATTLKYALDATFNCTHSIYCIWQRDINFT